MFLAITKFELRYHLKERLFYVLFALFFLLTFGAVASDSVQIGGAVGNVNRNSPFVIMTFMLVMSIFGILTTTAFVASSVLRDAELGTDQLFYTTRVSKWEYLLGRFSGSLIVSVLLFFGVSSAIFIGSLMPWVDKERLGPIMPSAYAFSFLALIVPNLLLMAAIAFAIAALSRSLIATWTGMVGFLTAWGVSSTMLANIENETRAAMLDPFGFGAFSIATRYWTVFDKNTKLLPIEGVFLMNRVVWMAIALVIFGGAAWLFSFTTGT
ncbi:MAG TPA: ABC transporter permease subunit, partial [Thermoanaerobaculia bacterium]|nr:ABC transporter permease subunit [Thermoanaerobaculia bacterium]